MPLNLAGVVLNDVSPEVEQGRMDGVFAYISVDRPQPDWKSAVEAIKTQMPGAVFQTEAMFEAMVRNTYCEGKDGLLHFDWDVNIVKPFIGTRGAIPNLWTYFRGLRPIPLLAFRGEVSDALCGGHEEGSGAARWIGYSQIGYRLRVAPVAHVVGDGEGGQEGRRGGRGVERAVVTGGVQDGVKDATEQVVSEAGDATGDGQRSPRGLTNGAGEGGIGRAGVERGASGLEDGLVVEGENQVPGVPKCGDGVV